MKELNFAQFPVLKTKRLILRKLSADDAQAVYNYRSDKKNYEFVDMHEYKTLKEASDFIAGQNKGVDENKWIVWAIEKADSNELIGTISIWNFVDKDNKAELGYGIFPGHRRRGYMSEVLDAVCKYGFEELALSAIEACTSVENIPSRKMLEKNGFAKIDEFDEESMLKRIVTLAVYEKKG